jgi:hypothetical protein
MRYPIDLPIGERQAAADALRRAMRDYPTLCAEGFGVSNLAPGRPREEREQHLHESRVHLAASAEEVATASAFLCRCDRTRTARVTSYRLKHAAESWGRLNGYAPYVSNGALLVAALDLELRVVPDDYASLSAGSLGLVSPNAEIGISRRSMERVLRFSRMRAEREARRVA